MDFQSFYSGAPTSPQNSQFYSAPSSPMQSDIDSGSYDHEFEFEITTRMFTNQCESSQQTYPSFWWTKSKRHDNKQEKEIFRLPTRAKSFCSGEVLPLKPPPRIHTSVSSSPRSPNSFMRIPFGRQCAWNDDFDPFQFALEKVSEETRARMSFHRRSQSYSAYRTSAVAHWLDGPMNNSSSKIFDHGHAHVDIRKNPYGHLKPRGPTLANMMDRRESVYTRRVISSEPIAKPRSNSNPMARTKANGLWLGKRVKDHESSCCTESKMQRVISFLFKLKKGSNESRNWKLRRCLGYAPGSPPFINK